ncbi:protein of unknown function [Nitrospira japonica]|uniref:Uncharacterized protein n=1 Tax=Nitrospira japonica TaxID=1325564 RepID=A0A1W1I1B4_9BACT|nr:hypothetical protein [Nitrospira japonica]SLM46771.1 protein of unknown function [Nitrospira japonica]
MASEIVTHPNPENAPVKPGRIPADDLAAIAARYRAGESLKLIGQSYGVTDEAVRQRLEKWALAGHGDTEFGQMVTDYLVENAIQAKDRMVNASDVLGLARGREEVRYWLWMLERRRPKLYGPKQHIEQDTAVTITINRTPPPVVNAPITVTGSLVDHSGNETDGSDS